MKEIILNLDDDLDPVVGGTFVCFVYILIKYSYEEYITI